MIDALECDVTDLAVVPTEGKIPFKGYETWYRIYGDGEATGKLPLLCLHGGPGAAHDYLESLAAMANLGRRVLLMTSFGRNRSSIPESRPEMWTADLQGSKRWTPCGPRWGSTMYTCSGTRGGMAGHGVRAHATCRDGEPDRGQLARQHDPVGAGGEPLTRGPASRCAGRSPQA